MAWNVSQSPNSTDEDQLLYIFIMENIHYIDNLLMSNLWINTMNNYHNTTWYNYNDDLYYTLFSSRTCYITTISSKEERIYVISDISYKLTRVVQLALSNAIGDLKHTIKEKTSGNELFNKSLFTKRVLNRHNWKTTAKEYIGVHSLQIQLCVTLLIYYYLSLEYFSHQIYSNYFFLCYCYYYCF